MGPFRTRTSVGLAGIAVLACLALTGCNPNSTTGSSIANSTKPAAPSETVPVTTGATSTSP